MRSQILNGAIFVVGSFLVAGCSNQNGSVAPAIPAAPLVASAASTRVEPLSARAMAITPLCPLAGIGPNVATCNSLLRSDLTPNPSSHPNLLALPGLTPNDLRAAYGLTEAAAAGGIGQSVAIVEAYHNPLLGADLAVYRLAFGLPPCTVLNGCLTFAAALGTPLNVSASWEAESDLDAEMVSAICPNCKIIVSEAPTDQIGDLAAAAGAAVAAGATVVSNSYSSAETASSLAYDHYYDAPGVPMTAGSGDYGYASGASYPASSKHVTAVGGTTLAASGGTFASESVWTDTGSGCSTIVGKPWWQVDGGCKMRTTNDVAVVGDPATGVAVFLTGFGGWNVLGGTSVGAPIVAAMYALAGNGKTIETPARLYRHRTAFRQLEGSNGSCSPRYLCTGLDRYTGPAGLGAPVGLDAF